jgi:hypothetical protein
MDPQTNIPSRLRDIVAFADLEGSIRFDDVDFLRELAKVFESHRENTRRRAMSPLDNPIPPLEPS